MENGSLKFDVYKEIYKIALSWSKHLFEDRRVALIKSRRAIFEKEGEESLLYRNLCGLVNAQVESCLSQIIDILLEEYKISDEVFQNALVEYLKDVPKMIEIRRLKEESESQMTSEIMAYLSSESKQETSQGLNSKKEVIAIHQKLFDLSVAHLKAIKERNLTPEQQQQDMQIIEAVLADKLFFATGVESTDLDEATERLKLEQDAEFQLMIQEYTQKVSQLNIAGGQ